MEKLLPHSAANPRNSEGSFVILKDGTIVFAYTRYNGTAHHDACPADIYLVRSKDNGQSWSEPELLVKNSGRNVMSASLLRLKDGRIAMLYSRKSMTPGYEFIDCRPWIMFSSDEMQSWSEPQDIAGIPSVYLVNNNDRLVQLSNGRLILPAAFHRYLKDRFGRAIALFFISDDGGANWIQSTECCYPMQSSTTGLQEPGVIELASDQLMAWFRTSEGCQYKSFSYDNGMSWSVPVPAAEFPSPASPLSMKRNPVNGELYAVWNDYSPVRSVKFEPGIMGRTPLVIGRSADNGKSWNHTVIENSPIHGYAYTAMYFNGDDLLLAYCCGGTDTCKCMLQDMKIRIIKWKELA